MGMGQFSTHGMHLVEMTRQRSRKTLFDDIKGGPIEARFEAFNSLPTIASKYKKSVDSVNL